MSQTTESQRWEAIGLVAIGLLIVCALVTATVYEASSRRQYLYQSTDQNLGLLVAAFAEYTGRTLQNIEQMMRTIDADLAEFDLGQPESRDMAYHVIRRRVADSTILSAVNVLDTQGNLLVSSDGNPAPAINYADRAYFAQTMAEPDKRGIHIGESVISRGSGRRVVVLTSMSTAQHGMPAMIVVGIDMERWTSYFGQLAAMRDVSVALFRIDGHLIARHPMPADDMYARSYADGTLFSRHLAFRDSGIFRAESPVDNIERRIAFRKLETYPLAIAVTANQSMLDESWRESIRLPTIGGIGATLLAILTTLALLRILLIRSEFRAQLAWQASHDATTALPNRYLFEDRLRQAVKNRERNGGLLAVMFFDLDHFKRINDTMGHAVGDQLLRATGQRIAETLRQSDTVARFGGDEFAVLLPSVASAESAQLVAAKILARFNEPIALSGREFTVTVSVGIATAPTDGQTPSELMACADVAMYSAKEAGRNKALTFDRGIVERMRRRLRIEECLQRACALGELRVVFQPVCSAGRPVAAEALMRWKNPELGEIPPSVFIPIAEGSRLIDEIGDWILREACRHAVTWPSVDGQALKVSVNASARQLANAKYVDTVLAALAASGMEAGRLSLEVTESLLIDPDSAAISNLARLRQAGIGLSLDDFGTGYASLSYLSRMPITTLKIDRSFVANLPENSSSRALASAITAIAASLNLATIAEGVETAEQRDQLIAIGCHLHQGYLYSRPLEVDAFLAWLQAQ